MFGKRIKALFILAVFTVILPAVCFGANYKITPEIDKLIRQSIEACIVHKYAEAESAAVRIIRLSPNTPEGYFYRAAVVYSMIIDYEELIRPDDFNDYLNKAESSAKNILAKEPNCGLSLFFLGSSKAYRSSFYLRCAKYYAALNEGLSSVDYLRKALEADSSMYDAYMGIGSYDYWLSRKTAFLRYLPLITDQRAKGINELYTAVSKGRYSPESASSALAWVLIDAGRPLEAVKVTEPFYKKYPSSRFFMFSYARALFDGKEYAKSVKIYTELLCSIQSAPRNNYFNEIGVYHKLAEANYCLKNYRAAAEMCRKGLNLPLSPEMRKEKSKVMDELKKLEEASLKETKKK